MAAVSEKQVPRLLSIGAIVIGVAVSAALFAAGLREPRAFGMTMAVNHHLGGYAQGAEPVSCQACHVPVAGRLMATRMDCFTGGCHMELQPGVERQRAIEHYLVGRQDYGDAAQRAEFHLMLHAAAGDRKCVDCHAEHRAYDRVYPEGFEPYYLWLRRQPPAATSGVWRRVGEIDLARRSDGTDDPG
ncbi:MAG: hypothetical protein KF858_07720 [Candidatus Sumerlaeia bacterium]|nr:hypothetical protein [Candidatus Sumerlaeia bacterium]